MSEASDKATVYLENAKASQEQLWKRRQIEWRTGFALWASIGVVTVFLSKEIKECVPSLSQVSASIVCAVLIAAFGLVYWAHRRHLVAIFISNEKDLDFLLHYRDLATWAISGQEPDKKPQPPRWAEKTRDIRKKEADNLTRRDLREYRRTLRKIDQDMYELRRNKMRLLNISLCITVLAALGAVGILCRPLLPAIAGKATAAQPGGAVPTASKTCDAIRSILDLSK